MLPIAHLEYIATICGAFNIFFTIRLHYLNWVFGIVMVIIYAAIFFHVKLYADMVIQMIALLLQLYGLKCWLTGRVEQKLKIIDLNPQEMILLLCVIIFSSAVTMFLLSYTDSRTIFLDGFTSAASLVAMWLQGRKIIQHWWLWIIIDASSIPMYLMKALYPTSFLYFIFTLLNIYGYIQWQKTLSVQSIYFNKVSTNIC